MSYEARPVMHLNVRARRCNCRLLVRSDPCRESLGCGRAVSGRLTNLARELRLLLGRRRLRHHQLPLGCVSTSCALGGDSSRSQAQPAELVTRAKGKWRKPKKKGKKRVIFLGRPPSPGQRGKATEEEEDTKRLRTEECSCTVKPLPSAACRYAEDLAKEVAVLLTSSCSIASASPSDI